MVETAPLPPVALLRRLTGTRRGFIMKGTMWLADALLALPVSRAASAAPCATLDPCVCCCGDGKVILKCAFTPPSSGSWSITWPTSRGTGYAGQGNSAVPVKTVAKTGKVPKVTNGTATVATVTVSGSGCDTATTTVTAPDPCNTSTCINCDDC